MQNEKPSQFTLELLKEKELEKGEPYDREVAQGLHPEHEQDLLNVIARHQDTQSKEVKKKVAKALVKWGTRKLAQNQKKAGGIRRPTAPTQYQKQWVWLQNY